MQVALFLIPLLIVIGWGMGNGQVDLSFDLFQVAVLFMSVLLANYLFYDGKAMGLRVCCWFAYTLSFRSALSVSLNRINLGKIEFH
jgi:Ca2+:H+ antiporter